MLRTIKNFLDLEISVESGKHSSSKDKCSLMQEIKSIEYVQKVLC